MRWLSCCSKKRTFRMAGHPYVCSDGLENTLEDYIASEKAS